MATTRHFPCGCCSPQSFSSSAQHSPETVYSILMCTIYILYYYMKSQQESVWRKRRLQVDRHSTYVTYHWKYAYERHEIWCDKKASGDGRKRFVNARQRMPLSGCKRSYGTHPSLNTYVHLCKWQYLDHSSLEQLNTHIGQRSLPCQAGCKAKVSPSIRSRPKKIHPSIIGSTLGIVTS